MITTEHGTLSVMTASEIAGLVRQVELSYDHGLISLEEARRTLGMRWEPCPDGYPKGHPATTAAAEDATEQARREA